MTLGVVSRWAAFWVLVAACFGGFGYVAVTGTPEPVSKYVAPALPEASPDPSRVVALFVGDSYTDGFNSSDGGYVPALAEDLGWSLAKDAQSGTGFLADGHVFSPDYVPVGKRLDGDLATYQPDVVVIDAGRNDRYEKTSGPLRKAVSSYLARAKKGWPDARIVVIQPTFVGTLYGGDMGMVQDTVKAAAEAADVDYMTVSKGDVAPGGDSPGAVSKDNVHPTDAGYALFTKALAPKLRALKIR